MIWSEYACRLCFDEAVLGRWLLVAAAVVAFVAVLTTSYHALWLAFVFLGARAAIAVGTLARR